MARPNEVIHFRERLYYKDGGMWSRGACGLWPRGKSDVMTIEAFNVTCTACKETKAWKKAVDPYDV